MYYDACLLLPSTDNLCKQFVPSSGMTKMFDTLIINLDFFCETKDWQTSESMKITHHPASREPRTNYGRLNTYHFVCGTMSCAKSSLHWSIIHYLIFWAWFGNVYPMYIVQSINKREDDIGVSI